MSHLKTTLFTLAPMLLIFVVVTKVLSFLGIGIGAYAIYLLWIIATFLFYAILPSKQSMLKF